jgi:antitoxin ParD1/3/4
MPSSMKQLNVSITPHLARFIQGKVKSGRYSNASEVVREALRRFEQADEIRQQDAVVDPDNSRDAVAKGFASIERGDSIHIHGDVELREFFADIIARGTDARLRIDVRSCSALSSLKGKANKYYRPSKVRELSLPNFSDTWPRPSKSSIDTRSTSGSTVCIASR